MAEEIVVPPSEGEDTNDTKKSPTLNEIARIFIEETMEKVFKKLEDNFKLLKNSLPYEHDKAPDTILGETDIEVFPKSMKDDVTVLRPKKKGFIKKMFNHITSCRKGQENVDTDDQDELDTAADVWNAHKIRPSRNPHVPSGRPTEMYYVPSLWGSEDQLCAVAEDDVLGVLENLDFRSNIPCDDDVYDLCIDITRRHGVSLPLNVAEAVDYYLFLRREITALL